MRLTNLADELREAGLEVVEVKGWKTRGAAFPDTPRVVIAHHTASNKTSGNMPSLDTLINGRPDLSGPLCQVGLSRNGVAYVIASGKANHAGPGAWRGYNRSEQTIGIEAENNGLGEPWPKVQRDAYDKVAATLLRICGSDATLLCGHKEWALPKGRKPDPVGIDMNRMRARVGRLLEEEVPMTLSDKDVDRIAKAVWDYTIRTNATEGPTKAGALLAWAWAHAKVARQKAGSK